MINHQLNSTDPNINNNDEGYWMSIGDLMSGLMFIFILALSVFLINIIELTEKQFKKEQTRKEMLRDIQHKMKAQGFTNIIIASDRGILRLEQGILFKSGKAKLLPKGKKLLRALGPIIYNVLSEPKYQGQVETIFIEGHTDNVPVSKFNKFKSNWDLSAQRAINTWLFLKRTTDSLEYLLNKHNEKIFSVSGYADTRPIATNKTKVGRSKNRRIDFRFNMIPPDSKSEQEPKKEIEQQIND